jgi:hypothetical protein
MAKDSSKTVKSNLDQDAELSLTEDFTLDVPTAIDREDIQLLQINDLLRDWIKQYSERYKAVKIDLDLQLEDSASIRINPLWLKRLIDNLIRNAVDAIATLEQPKITLSTRRVGDVAEISLTDNGPGIPEELRNQLFKKPIEKKTGGSGLGLLLAHFIAQQHGGNLRYVESKPVGATFTVSFPLKRENIIILNPPSTQKLSPQYLMTSIGPFLNALVQIQQIVNETKKKPSQEIAIKSIQQHSPISVSLDGAADAIQLVQETVIPWRRKHAETMSRLLEQEKQAEIESKKAEILEKRAHAEKDRVEASKQRIEAEKLKLENEKLRLELHREKIQLVIDMLNQIAPNMTEKEKMIYLVKLLPPVDSLIESGIDMV